MRREDPGRCRHDRRRRSAGGDRLSIVGRAARERGAQRASWAKAPELRALMTRAVQNARAPIFFFQAENDHDLTPSRALSAAMRDAGKPSELKIYPRYGSSAADGHALGYFGADVWSADVFRFLDAHCR